VDLEPRCSASGCDRKPEAGRSRCRTCRRAQTEAKQNMRLTRYSERRAPDGTLLGSNSSFIPVGASAGRTLNQAQPVNVTVNVTKIQTVYTGPAEGGTSQPGAAWLKMCDDTTTALILPDPQIGWRMTDHGLEPFHDADAMAVAVQIAAAIQPDVIVHLGDFLDFAPFSRFAQETGFRNTTQAGIDAGYRFLAELRAGAPSHKGWLIAGNHDKRISDTLSKLAPELARLRRADTGGWPVMSLPGLLRLDEVGVEFIDGYPAGELWLSPKLRAEHGHRVTSGGSTAALMVKDLQTSTLFGHVHRSECHYRTFDTYDGPRTVFAYSPGTLARTDGAVPSFHSGVDSSTAASKRRHENWQQGVGVLSWSGDSDPIIEHVAIRRGVGTYRGVQYSAPTRLAEAA
jgi:hypothetical protein